MLTPTCALRMAVAVCVAVLFAGCYDCTYDFRVLLDRTDTIRCCGDAREYDVSQDIMKPVEVNLSLSGAPTPTAKLRVVIRRCESQGPSDCAPVADQTVSVAGSASVSGRNIQLHIIVSNDATVPVVSRLVVKQGSDCSSPFGASPWTSDSQ
jgi:hypothetical protein